MYRILISDKLGDAGLQRLQQAGDADYDVKLNLSKEDLISVIPEYEAIIVRSGTKVDADVLDAAENLKVVGRAGIGVDNIDVRAATMKGTVVMNTPTANSVATAEQTMTLMLALSRHTAPSHASLKAGEWQRSAYVGVELHEKTLGIIGFGRIGRLVAERAQAFGMDVIAYDPFIAQEVGREMGVALIELEAVLRRSDYITMHSATTPETENMIDAEAIAQMKDGARFINAARGKLVDEAALAQALQEGKLAGAAVDVYSVEPPVDNPLIGLPNVLHTPHLGASTVEAQQAVATQIVDQILDALRGNDLRNAINAPYPAGVDLAKSKPYMTLAERMGILQHALAPAPIQRVEVQVAGGDGEDLLHPVATAVLKGLLSRRLSEGVNDLNAQLLAEENGITVSQSTAEANDAYASLISCRVQWEGGERMLSGALWDGSQPRLVQVNGYQLDAPLQGTVLILQNNDVPGVIGQVGTILAAYDVNVGEWHMNRQTPGEEALSIVNLDGDLPAPVLEAVEKIPAVTLMKVVTF